MTEIPLDDAEVIDWEVSPVSNLIAASAPVSLDGISQSLSTSTETIGGAGIETGLAANEQNLETGGAVDIEPVV